MVDQVKHYGGFYIGRYETTIDESGNIGSKYNTEVLTAGTILFTNDGTNYPYRWYGLYMAQKNANVTGNKDAVQTAMIYGQLWDKAMEYIRTQKTAGKTNYNVDLATSGWHSGSSVVNSDQANSGDEALNILDLESNAYEWTQEARSADLRVRVNRGGYYGFSEYAFNREKWDGCYYASYSGSDVSSRLALYIK